MLAEPLAETSPASLRAASFMLGKRFNGGVDDLDGYVYLQKLLVQHALNLALNLAETHADLGKV